MAEFVELKGVDVKIKINVENVTTVKPNWDSNNNTGKLEIVDTTCRHEEFFNVNYDDKELMRIDYAKFKVKE